EPILLSITSVRLYKEYNYNRFSVALKNSSRDYSVDAFDVEVKAFDKYGDQIGWYGNIDNTMSFTNDACKIKPNGTYSMKGENAYWDLFGYDTASSIKVSISRYHTLSGETIDVPEDIRIWVDGYK